MNIPKIISVHSFRRGTGKSNIIANIAALLTVGGWRVGVIDTNIHSPSLHILFGLKEEKITYTLNDYLWGRCDITQAAYEVTLPSGGNSTRPVCLIPASTKTEEISQVLRKGYDINLLNAGIQHLVEVLGLDVLMVDTHAGLNEETLQSIAISDTLVVLLRTDQQDYQGTGITVQVAQELKVPRLMLIVNEVPSVFDFAAVQAKIAQTYDCEVVAVLPHLDELMALASRDIFVLRYPDHPMTATLQQVANKLVA